jgi:orotidine-5'-phosphate decarboxylase
MGASALAVANANHRPDEIDLRDRLIVALDVPTKQNALDLVEKLGDSINFYKIGWQLFFAGGIALADELMRSGKMVFLDTKIHEIPEIVQNAVADMAAMNVSFVTVHGNDAAIRAAIQGRGSHSLKILSVTLLTSLDAADMQDLGLASRYSIEEIVLKRAQSALDAGADGVIASGKEAAQIRKMAGNRLLIVTPGIRSKDIDHHDQKRVTSPAQAISSGADYLVVGRQIIESSDPKKMAESIFDEIRGAIK